MVGDVIKSYLVSLGFSVDNNSFNEFGNAMGQAEKSVNKLVGSIIPGFAKADLAVSAFFVTATVGAFKFLQTLGKLDIENQKFAKKMWMSPENARAMQSSLKAMGATLEDLYYSPELLHNFQMLRQEAKNMQTPGDMKDEMKFIRSITFEFQRMKLELTYALQWIGYYMIKYLFNPLDKFKFSLKDLNDKIIKTMPEWTKQVAQVVSWFVRMGEAGFKALGDLKDMFDKLPGPIKAVAGAVGVLALALKGGPLGVFLTAISGILLLLDDYYGWQRGEDSLFGKQWEQLDKFYKKLQESGAIDRFANNMLNGFDKVKKFVEDVITGVERLYSLLQQNGTFDGVLEQLSEMKTNVKNLAKALADVLVKILSIGDDKSKDSIQSLADAIKKFLIPSLKFINGVLQKAIDILNFIKGNKLSDDQVKKITEKNDFLHIFKNIGKSFGTSWQDFQKKFPSYMIPSGSATTSGTIELKPTYNIYSNGSPDAIGKSITTHEKDLLIRALKGVN